MKRLPPSTQSTPSAWNCEELELFVEQLHVRVALLGLVEHQQPLAVERFEVGFDTHGLVGLFLLVRNDREADSRLFRLACDRLFEHLLKEGVLQGVVLLHDVYRAASAGPGIEVE